MFLTLQVMGAVICGQNPKCRGVEDARKMPGSVVLHICVIHDHSVNNTHIISAEAAFRTVSRRKKSGAGIAPESVLGKPEGRSVALFATVHVDRCRPPVDRPLSRTLSLLRLEWKRPLDAQ